MSNCHQALTFVEAGCGSSWISRSCCSSLLLLNRQFFRLLDTLANSAHHFLLTDVPVAVSSAAPRRHLRVKHLYPRNLEALLTLRLLIELLLVDCELVHVLPHALLRLEG